MTAVIVRVFQVDTLGRLPEVREAKWITEGGREHAPICIRLRTGARRLNACASDA